MTVLQVKTLRLAINYILQLQNMLSEHEKELHTKMSLVDFHHHNPSSHPQNPLGHVTHSVHTSGQLADSRHGGGVDSGSLGHHDLIESTGASGNSHKQWAASLQGIDLPPGTILHPTAANVSEKLLFLRN